MIRRKKIKPYWKKNKPKRESSMVGIRCARTHTLRKELDNWIIEALKDINNIII